MEKQPTNLFSSPLIFLPDLLAVWSRGLIFKLWIIQDNHGGLVTPVVMWICAKYGN